MIRKGSGAMILALGVLIILNIQCLLFSEACLAQGCAQTKKEKSLELREGLERLCSQLEGQCKEHNIPGLAIAVVKRDKTLLSRAFGFADRNKTIPVTEDTLWQSMVAMAWASVLISR